MRSDLADHEDILLSHVHSTCRGLFFLILHHTTSIDSKNFLPMTTTCLEASLLSHAQTVRHAEPSEHFDHGGSCQASRDLPLRGWWGLQLASKCFLEQQTKCSKDHNLAGKTLELTTIRYSTAASTKRFITSHPPRLAQMSRKTANGGTGRKQAERKGSALAAKLYRFAAIR